MEVLLRWNRPGTGMVSPCEFTRLKSVWVFIPIFRPSGWRSTGIMRATLRQTNQRSGLCVTPDLFDHLIRLPRLVSLLWAAGRRRSQTLSNTAIPLSNEITFADLNLAHGEKEKRKEEDHRQPGDQYLLPERGVAVFLILQSCS